VKLPGKVATGEKVLAKDFNDLLDFVRSLELRHGPGYRAKRSMGGTVFNLTRKSAWREVGGENPPFSVRELVAGDDGAAEPAAGWWVTLEPGRVIGLDPGAAAGGGDGVQYKIPVVGVTPMDELVAETGALPRVFVPVGGFVYCKIERDGEGLLTGDVEIVAEGAAVAASAHYQPGEAGGAGVAEEYQMRRLFEISLDADEVTAVVKYWQKSDIELGPILQAGENVGGLGSDVFKGWDQDAQRLQFYRVSGDYGLSDALSGDVVTLEFDGENVGAGVSGLSAAVFVEKGDGDLPAGGAHLQKAEFRVLAQGTDGDRRQIQIQQTDTNVHILGNGKNGSRIWTDCDLVEVARIEWEDGLVTSEGSESMILGNCYEAPTTPP
jgi:hypothetical protein